MKYIIFFLTFSMISSLEAASVKKRLLILGDSITEGYGIQKQDAFPNQLQILLDEKKKNVEVISAGISGSTSASAVKRLQWHLKKKPDVLILALGGNDGLRGIKPEMTKKNLNDAIKLATSKGVTVYLAGMKMPTNYGAEYRLAFESTFTDLVKENKIKTIPFLLEGVGGRKELNIEDGIHPNEKGHKIIANYILKNIQDSL